jgi:hypothetical protein
MIRLGLTNMLTVNSPGTTFVWAESKTILLDRV